MAVGVMENQRPEAGRPRSKSGFSFRGHKVEETDKQIITGKANPNAAMNEMQPVAAALEKPTLASLRGLSYNDQYGNLITDPDRSNPTRPRWERPLETIKSFEAAIDGEYKARRSGGDTQSEIGGNNTGYSSRRTSSYWGGGYDSARPDARPRHASYGSQSYGRDYNGYPRQQQQRPGPGGFGPRQQSDSTLMNRWNNHGYPNGGSNRGSPSRGSPNRGSPNRGSPNPNFQRSRDTLPSDSISAGSVGEPWASGTDPTNSENSSIDRTRNGASTTDLQTAEYNNFGGPIMEDGPYLQSQSVGSYVNSHSQGGGSYPPSTYNGGQGPAPPPKAQTRPIISLGGDTPPQPPPHAGMGGPVRAPAVTTPPEEKRKSWLRRKLSSRG